MTMKIVEPTSQSPIRQRNRPIIDYHTNNASFLQTSIDLKAQGIKNNKFFLVLYDRDLQGVNPFSPNLSQEMILKITTECMVNPWYFLRECCRIPEQGGKGIPYQLHRANLAATFCFLHGIDHYLVIPRQKGKTQSTIATLTWSYLFGTSSSEFLFVNKSQADANNNLGRLKAQRDLLPPYMRLTELQGEDGKRLKETNNVMSLFNPVTGNKIVTKPGATSELQAENIGRGSTQPIQYFDEVEFTRHIKTIIQAAGPAYNTASTTAKRNGAAYCRVLTSTPGDLDSPAGKDGLFIVSRCATWTEKFYDWTPEEIRTYIDKNAGIADSDGDLQEGNGIVYIEYSYKQLGDGESWLKKASDSLLNDKVKIKRELFLKRMRGSSESPFTAELLDVLQDYQKEPEDELIISKVFRLSVYEKLDPNRIYFVGVDVAHGLGNDNTAVTIIDPYTKKPVAEFASPYIGATDTSRFLQTLIRRHIPKGILCIERNNIGEAIIDYLRKSDVAHQLYYDNSKSVISDGIDDKLDDKSFLVQEAARRRQYGVWTQNKNRDVMFEILDAHMKDYMDCFVTKNITDDILSLVRKPSGRIEAGKDFHDDSIMSYLIAMYVFYHGKNLHRFGFERGRLPDDDERNQGLHDYNDTMDQLPDDIRVHFEHAGGSLTTDDLIRRQMAEVQSARRSYQEFDQLTGGARVEDLNDYDDDIGQNRRSGTGIDGSFFDMLND
ncbi:hypothetical protein D1872_38370 [compost metagenome]